MEEQFINKLFEMGIISGGFVYLLYLVTGKFAKTLDNVSTTLIEVGMSISGILTAINTLNERVNDIEHQNRRKDDNRE